MRIDKAKLLEYAATVGSCLGAFLNASQYISGFYVWCIANLFWVLMAIRRKQWGTFVTFTTFTIFNVYGILVWSGLWPKVLNWIASFFPYK